MKIPEGDIIGTMRRGLYCRRCGQKLTVMRFKNATKDMMVHSPATEETLGIANDRGCFNAEISEGEAAIWGER